MILSISERNIFYRLATFARDRPHQLTLCSLVGRCIVGLGLMTLAACLASFVVLAFGVLPVMDLYFWLFHGLAPDMFVLALWVAELVIVAVVFSYAWFGDGFVRRVSDSSTMRWASAAYRTVKDKTCVFIDVRS